MNEKFKKEIIGFIDNNKENIINDLSSLVKVDTVKDESTIATNMPYGKGVHKGYLQIHKILKKYNLHKTWMYKEKRCIYGYADFGNLKSNDILLIVVHVDTVPYGDLKKWDNPPTSGLVKDDCIYGRGSVDDKGAFTCMLSAIRFMKKAKIKIPFKIRLLVGGDEETSGNSPTIYNANEQLHFLGIITDGQFPFSYSEKSIFNYDLSVTIQNSIIEDIESPKAYNVVPDYCTATIREDFDILNRIFPIFLEENNLYGKIKKITNAKSQITIFGKSVHGMEAYNGKNAVTYLFILLNYLSKSTKLVSYVVNYLHNDFYGDKFNIKGYDDENKMCTNVNIGKVEKIHNTFTFGMNIRYLENIITNTEIEHSIIENTKKWFNIDEINNYDDNILPIEINLKCNKGSAGYIIDKKSKIISDVYSAYKFYSGDNTHKPYISSGGSYARYFPTSINYGPILSRQIYNAHCSNEKISWETLRNATLIYTGTICHIIDNFKTESTIAE